MCSGYTLDIACCELRIGKTHNWSTASCSKYLKEFVNQHLSLVII